jgi:hypothetical protein
MESLTFALPEVAVAIVAPQPTGRNLVHTNIRHFVCRTSVPNKSYSSVIHEWTYKIAKSQIHTPSSIFVICTSVCRGKKIDCRRRYSRMMMFVAALSIRRPLRLAGRAFASV